MVCDGDRGGVSVRVCVSSVYGPARCSLLLRMVGLGWCMGVCVCVCTAEEEGGWDGCTTPDRPAKTKTRANAGCDAATATAIHFHSHTTRDWDLGSCVLGEDRLTHSGGAAKGAREPLGPPARTQPTHRQQHTHLKGGSIVPPLSTQSTDRPPQCIPPTTPRHTTQAHRPIPRSTHALPPPPPSLSPPPLSRRKCVFLLASAVQPRFLLCLLPPPPCLLL